MNENNNHHALSSPDDMLFQIKGLSRRHPEHVDRERTPVVKMTNRVEGGRLTFFLESTSYNMEQFEIDEPKPNTTSQGDEFKDERMYNMLERVISFTALKAGYRVRFCYDSTTSAGSKE
jgi:hypothetical protein